MSFHPDERKKKKKQQSVSVSLERKKERKNYIPLDIVENRKRNVPVEREDFIAMNSRKKKRKKFLMRFGHNGQQSFKRPINLLSRILRIVWNGRMAYP